MSTRTSALAWGADVAPSERLNLLALSELAGDDGSTCTFTFSSLPEFQRMTGLPPDLAEGALAFLLGLRGDAWGFGSGVDFRFEDAVGQAVRWTQEAAAR